MSHAEAILVVCDENVDHVVSAINVLSLAQPDTDWFGELAVAAQQWQPFIDRGLSIDAWLLAIATELL